MEKKLENKKPKPCDGVFFDIKNDRYVSYKYPYAGVLHLVKLDFFGKWSDGKLYTETDILGDIVCGKLRRVDDNEYEQIKNDKLSQGVEIFKLLKVGQEFHRGHEVAKIKNLVEFEESENPFQNYFVVYDKVDFDEEEFKREERCLPVFEFLNIYTAGDGIKKREKIIF